jgi:hypothetical protein
MARTPGDTNSATSQWYFNLADNSRLDAMDGGFTVFGRILSGTNVLNRFNTVSPTNGIFRWELQSPLNELPVLSQKPTLADLVYTDISLLTAQVQKNRGGGREISWISVSNRMNHVEFTSSLPPQWSVLSSTNGNGNLMRVTDNTKEDGYRFYRVRIQY